MEPVTVKSYVRFKKQAKVTVKDKLSPNDWTALMIIGGAVGLALVLTIIRYWAIVLPVSSLVGATWGVIAMAPSKTVTVAPEPPVEPENTPKTKRHYQRRLVVNHFQTGKSVRV